MYLKNILCVKMSLLKIFKPRHLFVKVRYYSQYKHPANKTWQVLSADIKSLINKDSDNIVYPEHADIVIIGGGIIGSSLAYWFKTRAGKGLSVIVLEKDFTFQNASENMGFNGINQHFSLPENVLLSQYSAEFLRNVKQHLGDDVDIQFSPHGSLVIANDKYAELLEQNVTKQKELGVRNELLSPEMIKARYPWMNVDDVKLGCIGSDSEGWFNSWALHKGFILKSLQLGALYLNAQVTGFTFEQQRDFLMEGVKPGTYQRINNLKYEIDGEERQIKFAVCVLAGGPESANITKLTNMGTGNGLLALPLPIEPKSSRTYCIESNNNKKLSVKMPLVKDVNGMWIRRNGFKNNFICGHTPMVYTNTSHDKLSNEAYFDTVVRPCVAHRIPDLNEAKVMFMKTEVCDYNTYDESGIIGPHPYYNNLYFATGFGHQGTEHAAGIGRAVVELIIDSRYMTIDLTRLGFDRLLTDYPMIEVNSY